MGIKDLKPQRNSRTKQGYYKVENPEKYLGDPSKVIYRSSWEFRFMRYCDTSNSVLEWSSEPIAIPYISPLDERVHNYNPDFYAQMKVDSGVKKFLVEIKPLKDYAEKPVFEGYKTEKKLRQFKRSAETWAVNQAKFKAALDYADKIGMEFKIINENNIYNYK